MARASVGSSGASESLLDVLMRVNATQKENTRLQNGNHANCVLDKIIDKFGLYVIDFTINKVAAINSYVYKLCLDANRTESKIGSINSSDKQLQALTKSKSNHKVIIFDGLNCFNFLRFQNLTNDESISDFISMVIEPDQFKLLVTIYRYFSEQAALNINLRLIIIYCDDLYIRDLMEFLTRHRLSLHVILISYSFSFNYFKGLYNGEVQGVECLQIESSEQSICVKKTTKGKVKGIASFKQLTSTNFKL